METELYVAHLFQWIELGSNREVSPGVKFF